MCKRVGQLMGVVRNIMCVSSEILSISSPFCSHKCLFTTVDFSTLFSVQNSTSLKRQHRTYQPHFYGP